MIAEADDTEPAPTCRHPRGVLLIGHGTRDDVGTAQFFELAGRLAEVLSPVRVESALLEFQSPTIPEAWESLLEDDIQHVDVAPLLLFAAGHAKQDIPKVIADCQSKTRPVSVSRSRPISRHALIIDLVVERLERTLHELATSPNRTAVVLVGRGSHDPCAQADMRVLSEVVSQRIHAAATTTAFYAMAQPRLGEVLDRVAASGDFDAIAVHPHLLFEGRLFQAIVQQTEEASQRHPKLRIVSGPYLGPDARVAEAIAGRIKAASA